MATGDKDLRNDASKTDKRKQSLYFPESMLQEIKEEAARLDRFSLGHVQRAQKIFVPRSRSLPSASTKSTAATTKTSPEKPNARLVSRFVTAHEAGVFAFFDE